MENKKNNKGIIALIVVLLVILCGVFTYAVITNNKDNNNNTVNNTKKDNVNEELANKKIKELEEKGYKEINITTNIDELAQKIDDSKYKYQINWYNNEMKLDENYKMYLNGNDTGYKFKSHIGDEYEKYFITSDDYLYIPEKKAIFSEYKIKKILIKSEDVEYGTVVFEDGNTFEYVVD